MYSYNETKLPVIIMDNEEKLYYSFAWIFFINYFF